MSGGTQIKRFENITEYIHKELPRKPIYPTNIENTKKPVSKTTQTKQCVGLHVFDPNHNNPAVDNQKLNDFHIALNKRMDQYYDTPVCELSLIFA
jgi:hypothetical protein